MLPYLRHELASECVCSAGAFSPAASPGSLTFVPRSKVQYVCFIPVQFVYLANFRLLPVIMFFKTALLFLAGAVSALPVSEPRDPAIDFPRGTIASIARDAPEIASIARSEPDVASIARDVASIARREGSDVASIARDVTSIARSSPEVASIARQESDVASIARDVASIAREEGSDVASIARSEPDVASIA